MFVAPAIGCFASRMILMLSRGIKGERRSGSHKRLLNCVNVNRTSLDHLLLGVVADIHEMSHGASIPPGKEMGRLNSLAPDLFIATSRQAVTLIPAVRVRPWIHIGARNPAALSSTGPER